MKSSASTPQKLSHGRKRAQNKRRGLAPHSSEVELGGNETTNATQKHSKGHLTVASQTRSHAKACSFGNPAGKRRPLCDKVPSVRRSRMQNQRCRDWGSGCNNIYTHRHVQTLAVIAFAYEMELSAKPHAGKQPRGIGQINRHGTGKLACRQREERRWTTLTHEGTRRETVTTRHTVSDTKCAAKEAAGQRFLVKKKKKKTRQSVLSSGQHASFLRWCRLWPSLSCVAVASFLSKRSLCNVKEKDSFAMIH